MISILLHDFSTNDYCYWPALWNSLFFFIILQLTIIVGTLFVMVVTFEQKTCETRSTAWNGMKPQRNRCHQIKMRVDLSSKWTDIVDYWSIKEPWKRKIVDYENSLRMNWFVIAYLNWLHSTSFDWARYVWYAKTVNKTDAMPDPSHLNAQFTFYSAPFLWPFSIVNSVLLFVRQ